MANKTLNDVNVNLTLKPQTTRANLLSTKEDLAVQMGKIQKWYTDFAWSAWTAPDVEVIGSGNAVTSASYGTGTNANKLTLTKGTTFLTSDTQFIKAITSSGSGGAVTGMSVSSGTLTYTLGNPHPTISTQTDETSTASPVFGGTFTAVDSVTRDSNGHVLKINTKTITVPNKTMGAASASAAGSIGLVPAPAAGKQTSFLRGDGTWVVPTNTTYTAGTGLALSGTTFNHSNSVTARTDYMQPYIKYDAQGHITGSSYWMASAKGTDNTAGWVKVATIKHKMTYDNTPILLDVSQRGNTISYRIHIRWNNANSVDPPLGEFLIASDHAWESISPSAYIIKSDTSTWDLYILKLDSYEAIAMSLQPGLYFDNHTEWTWKDEQAAASAITGGTEATKKIYSTTDHTHDSLVSKTLTNTTLDGTAGNFFIKGTSLLGGINDWVGIQADAGDDKFQLIANANRLLFRQNDYGGTNTANWQAWNNLMTPDCVTGENGITARIIEISIGSGTAATTYNQGVKLGHTNSVAAVTSTSLLKFQYDAQGHITGSSAITKADITGLGIPASDTNNYVLQSNTSTANYRPILMGYTSKAASAISELNTTVTNQTYVNTKLYTQPSTGKVFSDGGYYINESSISYPVLYEGNVKHVMPKTMTDSWTDIGLTSDTTFGFKVVRGGTGSDAATPPDWWGGLDYKYGSGLAFGLSDSGGSISLRSRPNNTIPGITFAGGGRSSSSTKPQWYMSLTGTSGVEYDLDNLPGKYAFVYDNSSDFASYSWHKFAEVTMSVANADATVTFLVSQTWKNGGDPTTKTGILTAHIRTSDTKVFSLAHFKWIVAGDSIDPTEFVMVYTDTASTSCKVELWHKQTERYDGWVFKLLKEHSRTSYGLYPWKMYVYTESTHGLATYTAGTGTIVSSLNTIANTASSSNKINTDAGSNVTPVYFSGGIPVAVNKPASGAWFSTVPSVGSTGVIDIGRYINFHSTNAGTTDYDVRLDCSSTSLLTLSSNSGTPELRIAGTLPRLRFTQTTTGKSYDNAGVGIWCQPADTNGVNMFMQSHGNMMISSGEFCSNAYARKDATGQTQVGYDNIVGSTTEKLYLGADGEVQIISNGQSIAAYSNNNHRVWKFQTDGKLLTPNAITDSLDLQHTIIEQNLRSASNCVALTRWIVDGAASAITLPGIYYHNTGGDSTDKGAIILQPYHSSRNPWDSGNPIGLYIGKGILKLDGTNVSLEGHTHNYAGSSSAGGSATTVQGTLTNPTSDTFYPIPFHETVSTDAKTLRNNDGLIYVTKEGTASSLGYSVIRIGNQIASGTAGNKYGVVRIYSQSTSYIQLKANSTSSAKTQWLSVMEGTICCLNKNSTSYWGLYDGDGVATNSIRTTSNGFIPYQSGGLNSAHSSLGTSTWSFSSSWIKSMNSQDINVYNSDATKHHAITSIASANRTVTLPDTNCVVGTGFISVVGTHTSATKMWTGNLPIPELYDGLTIAFYVPYSSASSTNTEVGDTSANSNVWLKLTLSSGSTTDWIPAYWNNTSRLTTQYGAGSTVILTYWSAPKISGTTSSARWTKSDYNANSQVNVTLNTTSKAYLLATTSTPTSTATARSAVADTGVYLDTTAGMLTATSFRVNNHIRIYDANNTSRYTQISYNSTASGSCLQHLPTIDGEIQVSQGQTLMYNGTFTMSSSGTNISVQTDGYVEDYRLLLVELWNQSGGSSFHMVVPWQYVVKQNGTVVWFQTVPSQSVANMSGQSSFSVGISWSGSNIKLTAGNNLTGTWGLRIYALI